MKKILITAIGGDIGYGIIKALKSSTHDLYIIGCDIKKYTMSYDVIDEFFISPAYSEENRWMEAITDIIARKKVDYFLPVSEEEIRIVDQHRKLFNGVTLLINESNVLQIAMDKGLTAKYLLENGIITPATYESIDEIQMHFPMIVKERFGCGSHFVKVVHNDCELKRSFAEMKDPIVQEYIGNQDEEYTLAIFSNGKVTNHIAFKRQLGFGGMSRYVELVNNDTLTGIAHRIAQIFDLHGSINVQMRKSGSIYYVIEINPRISSTIGFRLQLGFNDISWWVDMVNEKDILLYAYPVKKAFGVRSVEEKVFYEDEPT